MDISEKIAKLIAGSLKKMGVQFSLSDIVIGIPSDSLHGEYSCNIALRFSSLLKKKPLEIAEEIIEKLDEDIDIDRVEAANPGFINFYLSNRYFLTEVSKIVDRGSDYFQLKEKEDKKIVIEYTDANPFKEFHIGHLYTNSVGESFARLQEALGADVKRANYQGDVGLHVAKALWGLEKKLQEGGNLEEMSLSDRIRYLGDAYVLGSEYYDEIKDVVAIQEIDGINQYVFSLTISSLEKGDFSKYEKIDLKEKYQKGRQWCLEYFEKIYEKLGTKFDYYFFESEVGDTGLKIVKENVGKVFEKDAGAIIYRGDEKKNLHTRVFVNKYGVPTYEAKELGLAFRKRELIDYDESIMITADEQSGYFKVVLDALSKIDKDLADKITHVSHGKVKLPGSKKMSSRKGGIIGGDWLVEETQRRVKVIMSKENKFDEEDLERISEKIAIGAIKYSFLKVGVGRDIVFDLDKSISFDGDTGPYLMYVYSRCNSILKEANFKDAKNICFDSCLHNAYTRGLVTNLGKYRSYLLDSAVNYSPSILSQYLFDLGQSFNSFYQNVRVLDAPEEEREVLLLIIKATMEVVKDGLNNLGIEVVEKM